MARQSKLQLSSSSFWHGIAVSAGLSSMFQDWLGLDGFIEHLRGHWINMPWWLGALVVVFALGSYHLQCYAATRKVAR